MGYPAYNHGVVRSPVPKDSHEGVILLVEKVTVLTFIEFIFICTLFPIIVIKVMQLVAGVI
jgi:hypothetical protein